VHCIGDFSQDDLAILARYACTPYVVPAVEPVIAENLAHFYLSQVLDRIAASGAPPPDQVLIIDNMRGGFARDPFLAKTIGLSVFWEGPTRIGESPYNRDRVAFFGPITPAVLEQPVISSMILRGPLPVLREFQRRMLSELVGRADLLRIDKVVQGAVNKLCYAGALGFPLTMFPNAAEVHFDFLDTPLAVDARHGVRIGGTVPGVILGGKPDSAVMRKLRIDLSLGSE